jgi:drug/metabolite transporter (DMT)-like permease
VGANRIKGIALVLAASALWGASGPLTKILRLDGFDILDILSWRYLIGFTAPLFAPVPGVFRRPSVTRRDRRGRIPLDGFVRLVRFVDC